MNPNRISFFKLVLIFGLFFVIISRPKAQTYQNNTNSVPQVDALFNQGKYQTVINTLWPQFDKLNRNNLILLAKSHLKISDPEKTIKVCTILISKNPQDHEAYFYLGNAYFLKSLKIKAGPDWKKSRQDSIDNYKKALEIKKNFIPAYSGLIQLYENEKNVYELRQLYNDLLEVDGEKFEWLIKLCEINSNDSIYDSALKMCQKASKIKPGDARSFVYSAKSLYGMGDKEKGKAQLKKVADKFKNSDFANLAYGDLLSLEKNYQDAFKYYSISVNLNPKSYEAWIGYSNSSFEIQKFSEALNGYSMACSLNKDALPLLRKAANIVRNNSNFQWSSKYDSAAERCALRK